MSEYPVPDKLIALSIDDGPSEVTNELLTVLKRLGIKASFFLIGQNVRNNQDKTKAIFDAGHEIGNHSDGYEPLGAAAADDIRESLQKTSAAIESITREVPCMFRAPNVNYGENLFSVCAEMGLPLIGISTRSSDWRSDVDTDAIISNVLSTAVNNGIINCHELQKTVNALPAMVHGLRLQGYEILTVGQLVARKGAFLEAGICYDLIE